MNRLDEARAYVQQQVLPEDLRRLGEENRERYVFPEVRLWYYAANCTQMLTTELTADVLADSMHYVIEFDRTPIGDESAAPIGISKYRGLPHLPPDLAWPKNMLFAAQYNCAELHPLDVHDVFPARGMLYVFYNNAAEVAVVHYDGPLEALRVRPYPDGIPDAKHYLRSFLRDSAGITFRPRVMLYVDEDDVLKRIPSEMRDRVAEIVGAPLSDDDDEIRIFGRPTCFQGEDELYDDELPGPQHLLHQDVLGDASIHIWIDPEHAARRDYSNCWMTYSST